MNPKERIEIINVRTPRFAPCEASPPHVREQSPKGQVPCPFRLCSLIASCFPKIPPVYSKQGRGGDLATQGSAGTRRQFGNARVGRDAAAIWQRKGQQGRGGNLATQGLAGTRVQFGNARVGMDAALRYWRLGVLFGVRSVARMCARSLHRVFRRLR